MPHRLLAPAATATLLCLSTTAAFAQTPPQPTGTMSPEKGWSSIARCAQESTERARHACLDHVLQEAGLLTNEMHAQQQRNAFGLENKPPRTAPAKPAPTANPATNSSAAPTAANAAGSSAAPTAANAAGSSAAPTAANAAGSSAAPTAANAAGSSAAPTAANAAGSPVAPTAAPNPSASAANSSAPAPARTAAAASPPSAPTAPPPSPPNQLEVQLARVDKAASGRLFVTTTDGAVWLQNETVDMPQPPLAGDRMTIRKNSLGGYRCSVVNTHLTFRCDRQK